LLLLARRPSTRRPDAPRPAPGVRKPNPSAMCNVPKPDTPRPAPNASDLHKPYPSDMSDG